MYWNIYWNRSERSNNHGGMVTMNFHVIENGFRTELGYGELLISGNENDGFRPFELMITSIVGCAGSVFLKILEKQRTRFEDLSITVEIERNPEEANRLEWLKLNFTIKGYNLNIDRLYKNLELSRKNCSMIRSVEKSIKIEETLQIIELS